MPPGQRRISISKPAVATIALATFVVAGLLVVRAVDRAALGRSWSAMLDDPFGVFVALAAFAMAFGMRALAWQRVLPGLSLSQSLAAIHLSLGANQVLPLRLGEPLRFISVARRTNIALDAAAGSTVALRAVDVVTVTGIGWLIAPTSFARLIGPWGWAGVGAVVIVGLMSLRWLATMAASAASRLSQPGPMAVGLTAGAWFFEAVVVWQAAHWAGLDLSAGDAMLVTAVAVSAQVAAIAPSGFGTYEAASVAAYAVLGHDPALALVAALTAHGLKTSYSLVAGAIAIVVPQPSLLGRLRLASSGGPPPGCAHPAGMAHRGERADAAGDHDPRRPGRSVTGTSDGNDAPVLLFMPALNEEASVAACVRRAPASVFGHRVQVLVIDDGSTDRTAEMARAAGAEVVSFESTRGLGAAVRFGLHRGAARGAAAVAFCDADEEYTPEELGNLIRPILADEADYVVGSRFSGTILHMRPHRRLGNIVLTRMVAFITRRPVTDGQSGYRAFSPAAAAQAEVIHDFNYAQVLTLDLLAKGYRYHEVPITYRFRSHGQSFVKLGGYLRRVMPAIYRELNTPPLNTVHPP